MQYPILYDDLPRPINNLEAVANNKWRQAFNLSARGGLSRANKDLIDRAQKARAEELALTCSITGKQAKFNLIQIQVQ